jgi:hypothetical protein
LQFQPLNNKTLLKKGFLFLKYKERSPLKIKGKKIKTKRGGRK